MWARAPTALVTPALSRPMAAINSSYCSADNVSISKMNAIAILPTLLSMLPLTASTYGGRQLQRREWDLNPRDSRPRLFKSLAFGRSAIPPCGPTLLVHLGAQVGDPLVGVLPR